jgi:Leucine-rich repeat (LRR) protein
MDDTTNILNLSGKDLRELPSLVHFKNLRELHIENNQLVFLPALPVSLVRLYCSNNRLKALPPLPYYLEILDCSDNPDLLTLPVYDKNLHLNIHNTGINLAICDGMNPLLYELTKNNR